MTASEITPPSTIALSGDWCLTLSRASTFGKAWIRPMANEVRLDTFTPALEFASVEFTMARKTRIQNRPYSEWARPSQEALVVLTKVVKCENLPGPNATST